MSVNDREKFRLKRLIRRLKRKTGRGTQLISLYIPPQRRISDVTSYLREEYSTSSNIKDSVTRKNVQNAIVKVMEKLKLFKSPPKTGLAIFCGAIPQDGPGSERMEIYTVVPPEPINISLYRCDSRFHLEPLERLVKEKEVYGLLSIDVNEAAIATLEGSSINMISKHTSGIPGKHRAGGQSARRFERLREKEVQEYFKRVADYVNQTFLNPNYWSKLKGIIIGGPGFTKREFAESKYLDYRLKDKIIGYVDSNYAGEEGIREITEKADALLKETRFLHERKLIDDFLREASSRRGLVTYGLNEVWSAVVKGNVKTILILENFEAYVIESRCLNCDFSREELSKKLPNSLPEERCPNCGKAILQKEVIELIDYLDDKSRILGFDLNVISSKTEHGAIFSQFGGIAAYLKFV